MSLKEKYIEIQENIDDKSINQAMGKIISLGEDYDLKDIQDTFMHTDDIDEFIKNRLDHEGWTSVFKTLQYLDNADENYYKVDYYGNLENVSLSTVKEAFRSLKSMLNDEFLEEEGEEDYE